MTKAKPVEQPTDRVTLHVEMVADTRARLEAAAKGDGMTLNGILMEAVYVHLHKLESRGSQALRRKAVCWSCGELRKIEQKKTRRASKC